MEKIEVKGVYNSYSGGSDGHQLNWLKIWQLKRPLRLNLFLWLSCLLQSLFFKEFKMSIWCVSNVNKDLRVPSMP